jgi:hypothetical protein
MVPGAALAIVVLVTGAPRREKAKVSACKRLTDVVAAC